MPWPNDRLRSLAGPAGDVLLVLGILGYAAGYLRWDGTAGVYSSAGMLAVLAAIGICLLVARRLPLTALAVGAGLTFALTHTVDPSRTGRDAANGAFLIFALLTYRVAVRHRLSIAITSTVLFAGAVQAAELTQASLAATVNPFLIVGTVGPCALGVMVRTRTQAQHELQARQQELQTEQARYVEQAIRYERTRIARELHDVVAHNVSLMVVQASAGHYLATRDPTRTASTFDHIAESARSAESEIVRLLALLDVTTDQEPATDLAMIGELVQRATNSGLSMTYVRTGAADQLPSATVQAAYRTTQEGITNALKHAPGAPIAIAIARVGDRLIVDVTNPPSPAGRRIRDWLSSNSLATTGGGHGLDGLAERVTTLGGRLDVGPTADGGWKVSASLPG